MPVENVLWECSKYLMANILVFIGNQRWSNPVTDIHPGGYTTIVRSTEVLEP